jgi:hypothetical protein
MKYIASLNEFDYFRLNLKNPNFCLGARLGSDALQTQNPTRFGRRFGGHDWRCSKVVHKEVGQVFPAAPQGIHRSRTPQGMHRSTQGELTSGYKRRFMSVQGVTMRRCHYRCQQEESYRPNSLDDLDLNYKQKATR